MKNSKLFKITSNFLAITLLIVLIAAPFYFANNFSQVAGVKSSNAYLVVSQVEKFPQMKLTQSGNNYQVTFTKQNPTQAYLSVLIINNPTNQTKTYILETPSDSAAVFLGNDLDNPVAEIKVPPLAAIPVSIMSSSQPSTQTVEFAIEAN